MSCRTDRTGLIHNAPSLEDDESAISFLVGCTVLPCCEAFAMMMATFVDLVESTCGFIMVSRYASATPLPPSILGRGVGWQGIGILLSGLFGTVSGDSVSIENVGLLALTRVGNRRFNNIVNVPFSSEAFVAAMVAFFLDNTLHYKCKNHSIRKDCMASKVVCDKFRYF
ncbi:nucleobase-ascorbate transporter 6-like protein [Tanacetum coccineum]